MDHPDKGAAIMNFSEQSTPPWPLPFGRPDWVPQVTDGMSILVTGASGGIGSAVVRMLLEGSNCSIGAHSRETPCAFDDDRVIPLVQNFSNADDCDRIIDCFVNATGRIDALVCLSGALHYADHWMNISEDEWTKEMQTTLDQPFFLTRAAMRHMKNQASGGRIVLTGTESALHGGSPISFPYAVAKRGTECMVQGMAREGASSDILVNGLRFGFIASGFHERWHDRTPNQMAERSELVPLKRGGHVDEAAALTIFLLSDWARFITGQMIPLTGGDWL